MFTHELDADQGARLAVTHIFPTWRACTRKKTCSCRRHGARIAQRFIAGDAGRRTVRVPEGRLNGTQPFLRDFVAWAFAFPALKRWAIVNRPSGTSLAGIPKGALLVGNSKGQGPPPEKPVKHPALSSWAKSPRVRPCRTVIRRQTVSQAIAGMLLGNDLDVQAHLPSRRGSRRTDAGDRRLARAQPRAEKLVARPTVKLPPPHLQLRAPPIGRSITRDSRV